MNAELGLINWSKSITMMTTFFNLFRKKGSSLYTQLTEIDLGADHSTIQFSWPTRRNICVGVARGLAFLHEEVRSHFIYRKIQATKVLLDEDLRPKSSHFGLAKLIPPSVYFPFEGGYVAPEHGVRNKVTIKSALELYY
ncbi:cold-responsive protein kinase 1-like [Vigna unguiculata]|uniref:cold-responsive protein kinase 1-like n=1 Tax=Vigna unguiculata TaxID=3917 RepID=UPI0010162EA2|nr:cold-responsive protein kinase 1-like [Vigna unguiculata]XP_027912010.1 cold-responsive protein kinase 1-like [Vigna unguiculata]